MTKPLLSVCIPTFNRSAWLESSLRALVPQVREMDGVVELIVSDNASTDRTPDVLAAAQQEFSALRVHRNAENVGFIGNMNGLAQSLAQGEWLWMLGDDDLVRTGAVSRVTAALCEFPQAEYFYVNYVKWDEPNGAVLLDPNAVPTDRTGSPVLRDELLPRLADLVGEDDNALTPLYSFVMRRVRARAAWPLAEGRAPFSDPESVMPHAVYAARHLLRLPAFRIGTPLVVASGIVSWSPHMPFYMLQLLPQLYDWLEQGGVARAAMDKHRRSLLGMSASPLARMLWQPDTAMRRQFSRVRFAWRYRRFPRALGGIVAGVLAESPMAGRIRALPTLPARAVGRVRRVLHKRGGL